MYIIPSFKSLKLNEKYRLLITNFLNHQYFNKEFYINEYTDLKEIDNFYYKNNAKEHYVSKGYFENRLAHDPMIDTIFYKSTYKDIRHLSDEEIKDHYKYYGYIEGRLPNIALFDENYYLTNYKHFIDVSVYNLNLEGLIRHYINEGYKNLFLPYNIFK